MSGHWHGWHPPLLWLAYGPTRTWVLFLAATAAFAAGWIWAIEVYWGFLFAAKIVWVWSAFALLFGAAIVFAQQAWRRLPPPAVLFAFPALWTAIEYTATQLSPHGSFGMLGHAETSFPAAIQIASLSGVFGVTFFLCLFANALALLARGARIAGAAGIALVALDLAFGFARLAQPQDNRIAVAALSDEALHKGSWHGGTVDNRKATDAYAAAIRVEAAKGVHDFVIPEGALIVPEKDRAAILAPLAAAAGDTRSVIVAGAIRPQPSADVAIAFTPKQPEQIYRKRHLLRPLENEFEAGDAAGPIGNGRAMVICKDMDFPGTIRADALSADPIRLMIVPAGDFGGDGWLHGRIAVMGGVSNGFAVLRAAFNGLQTISDAQGRLIASATTSRPGMIVTRADIPLGPGATLYARIGDVFAWLCLLVAAGCTAAMVMRRGARPD
jgi:apolipoprotein N-acyltransferase